ncbi:MAG: 50S ribosomal protein L29 [Candidatus Komeilibacteria bacterium RIFOXYC1_FULL_37_11]|uniref:Large ribosomal subunit protein uL29 n=1 Tax=Candidatus Komeilibacteria bacterium RIFOXYC1_FULL_37_11 TaxID=1798555 RepID=A0A1G2BYJ9_9BACT|nr:MAG: 50S ribosomal protein L29 [Candidatus Komeilibacteria bacterium RIFOXYC1_FULL_37_11]OGY95353.1 MAG: 50S ribosomal protein L29 [Candidatus Komeilibacteria bacterium RIFOXYD1_FULL_37_29]OGY97212.1 MAG: 50S ribosomal protein L29 [Candidatus Komeilibacteria bacterium RIFOXYD2_FULL_37_8]
MKISELRKLDIEKLNDTLAELRNKNRELRFSITNNQLKNVRQARVVKKEIAKILTALNEKRTVAEDLKQEK